MVSVANQVLIFCLTLGLFCSVRAEAEPATPLISRDILFGNPDRSNVRLSPDARMIAWTSPHNGVMNIWVAPVDQIDKARVVTKDTNGVFGPSLGLTPASTWSTSRTRTVMKTSISTRSISRPTT